MPRSKSTRNPLGTILEKKIVKHGRKIKVWDVRKRTPKTEVGQPLRDERGRIIYQDTTKRCYSYPEAVATLRDLPQIIQKRTQYETPGSHTFFELCAYFEKEYLKPAVFANGIKITGYKTDNNRLRTLIASYQEYFGDIRLSAITPEALSRFKEHISLIPTPRGGLPKTSTINEKLSFLRRLLSVAEDLEWITRNPFSKKKRLINRAAEDVRDRILSFEEEKRLLAACTGRQAYIKPLIIVAVDTGLRLGEIFHLKWDWIDLSNRYIRIPSDAQYSKTGKKGVVPITARVAEIFKNHPHRNHGRPLFETIDFKKSWAALCERAQVSDFQFRDLRTTATTRMREAGIDSAFVNKITRNSRAISEKNYTVVNSGNASSIGAQMSEYVKQGLAETEDFSDVSTV